MEILTGGEGLSRRIQNIKSLRAVWVRVRIHRGIVLMLSPLILAASVSAVDAEVRFVASGRFGAAFANDLTLSLDPQIFAVTGNFLDGPGFGQSQPGYEVGGSLGLQFGNWIRWDVFDLGYSFTTQNFSFPGPDPVQFDTNASTLVYGTGVRVGRFSPEARWRPFVSVGLGAAYARLNAPEQALFPFLVTVDTIKGWGFEWDVGAGIEFGFADRGAAAVRLRYRQSHVTFRKDGLAIVDLFGTTSDAFPTQSQTLRIVTLGLELSFIGP